MFNFLQCNFLEQRIRLNWKLQSRKWRINIIKIWYFCFSLLYRKKVLGCSFHTRVCFTHSGIVLLKNNFNKRIECKWRHNIFGVWLTHSAPFFRLVLLLLSYSNPSLVLVFSVAGIWTRDQGLWPLEKRVGCCFDLFIQTVTWEREKIKLVL